MMPSARSLSISFEQVLEKAYIDRILSYTNEKVVFSRENKIAENQVEVQTKIITSSKEIPIAYRVILSERHLESIRRRHRECESGLELSNPIQ